MSAMPRHLSGCGSSDLARNVSLSAKIGQLAASCVLPNVAVDADQVAEVELLASAQPVSPTCFWPRA